MRISIITTVYNAADDIRVTIDSVLSQTGVDIEYIITDGGSTDGTLDIIKEYPEIILKSESDNGIYDGMNKGIAMATGDIIGILNAADIYEPEALSRVIQAAVSHPECGVFHGKMLWFVDGEVTAQVGQAMPETPKKNLMPVCHPTTFIRRETYEKYGSFDDSYKIAADHKLIHFLHSEGVKFHFIESVIARMEGGGASGQYRKIKCDEVLRTMMDYDVSYKEKAKVKLGYYLFTLKDKAKKIPLLNTPGFKRMFWKISKIVK